MPRWPPWQRLQGACMAMAWGRCTCWPEAGSIPLYHPGLPRIESVYYLSILTCASLATAPPPLPCEPIGLQVECDLTRMEELEGTVLLSAPCQVLAFDTSPTQPIPLRVSPWGGRRREPARCTFLSESWQEGSARGLVPFLPPVLAQGLTCAHDMRACTPTHTLTRTHAHARPPPPPPICVGSDTHTRVRLRPHSCCALCGHGLLPGWRLGRHSRAPQLRAAVV